MYDVYILFAGIDYDVCFRRTVAFYFNQVIITYSLYRILYQHCGVSLLLVVPAFKTGCRGYFVSVFFFLIIFILFFILFYYFHYFLILLHDLPPSRPKKKKKKKYTHLYPCETKGMTDFLTHSIFS